LARRFSIRGRPGDRSLLAEGTDKQQQETLYG
jgi:hypothetical protein